ncbi:hypothetical protein ANN_01242 [Periplaneta americana]|uniref:Uncharacterized protein n=1 Tax=Periplaneta americana TaxID=6978 RepID=A0ABQ8TVF8_PERAM|nr:hypothetical protein ANN_01242 [Periplaneta americana]
MDRIAETDMREKGNDRRQEKLKHSEENYPYHLRHRRSVSSATVLSIIRTSPQKWSINRTTPFRDVGLEEVEKIIFIVCGPPGPRPYPLLLFKICDIELLES